MRSITLSAPRTNRKINRIENNGQFTFPKVITELMVETIVQELNFQLKKYQVRGANISRIGMIIYEPWKRQFPLYFCLCGRGNSKKNQNNMFPIPVWIINYLSADRSYNPANLYIKIMALLEIIRRERFRKIGSIE